MTVEAALSPERGELLDAAGRPIELRAQALHLLLVLAERPDQVVSKDELMRRVWGDVVVTDDSLVQAIGDIRRAIGDARHERLRTVPRRGYRLVVEDATAAVDSATATDVDALSAAAVAPRADDAAPVAATPAAVPVRARWPVVLGVLLLLTALLGGRWHPACVSARGCG